ncbi:hypothetical protein RI367_003989 [Sorochytrium milnesiophthora]
MTGVQVALRVRPPKLNNGQLVEDSCVQVNASNQSIAITAEDGSEKQFMYDFTLASETQQSAFYDTCVRKLIDKCLEGYNGCIFCYGQSASGKTFTMQGPSDLSMSEMSTSDQRGIIQRVAEQITAYAADVQADGDGKHVTVRASYIEIYQEKLADLLLDRNHYGSAFPPPFLLKGLGEIRIRKDSASATGSGVTVSGVTECNVERVEDYMGLLAIGSGNRAVGETNMNSVSSRSHAILTLNIEQVRQQKDKDGNVVSTRKSCKLHLIDLAGSERADSTGATGQRLKEGSAINQSLSCLGNVINALTSERAHVPYRDSKLTYLLSDSLGGNSLTLMVACVNPTSANHDESISTLRFAERVKKVKNNAVLNVDPASKRIMELEAEVATLRQALSNCKCGAASGGKGVVALTKQPQESWCGGPEDEVAGKPKQQETGLLTLLLGCCFGSNSQSDIPASNAPRVKKTTVTPTY